MDSSGPAPLNSAPQTRAPAAKVEPISNELSVLRMTVGKAFALDLEAVRDALSHQIPDRRLETVVHECMRRTLKEHRRRAA